MKETTLCGRHLWLRHLGKGLLGGSMNVVKIVVSSDTLIDTLENEVIEEEVVKGEDCQRETYVLALKPSTLY